MTVFLTDTGWTDYITGDSGIWTNGNDAVSGTPSATNRNGIQVDRGVTANTLDGDDSITGSGVSDSNDFTYGIGNYGTIDTGCGNDAITGSAIDNQGTIDTGAGNDSITGSGGFGIGNAGMISTGDGNDAITGSGGTYGIYNNGSINTGDGNDSITGSGVFGIYNSGSINTGDGDDIVTANGGFSDPFTGSTFLLGNGDDTLSGFGTGHFDGGPGMDMLILPELPAGQKYEFATSADGMTVTLGSTVMYTTGFEFLQIGNIWLLTSNSFEQANSNWTPNFTALGS